MAAKKEAAVLDNAMPLEVQTKMIASSEKKVRIKLFKDAGDYKDDMFVSVNGLRYQIQRGVEVEVPVFVAEVIANSQAQDQKTVEYIAGLQDEYASKKM